MVVVNCEICGKRFESEGHELGEWLNLCHRCNILRSKSGEGSVLDSDAKLKRLYKKLGGMI